MPNDMENKIYDIVGEMDDGELGVPQNNLVTKKLLALFESELSQAVRNRTEEIIGEVKRFPARSDLISFEDFVEQLKSKYLKGVKDGTK